MVLNSKHLTSTLVSQIATSTFLPPINRIPAIYRTRIPVVVRLTRILLHRLRLPHMLIRLRIGHRFFLVFHNKCF